MWLSIVVKILHMCFGKAHQFSGCWPLQAIIWSACCSYRGLTHWPMTPASCGAAVQLPPAPLPLKLPNNAPGAISIRWPKCLEACLPCQRPEWKFSLSLACSLCFSSSLSLFLSQCNSAFQIIERMATTTRAELGIWNSTWVSYKVTGPKYLGHFLLLSQADS